MREFVFHMDVHGAQVAKEVLHHQLQTKLIKQNRSLIGGKYINREKGEGHGSRKIQIVVKKIKLAKK